MLKDILVSQSNLIKVAMVVCRMSFPDVPFYGLSWKNLINLRKLIAMVEQH
jgi:hypothetical protein